MTDGYPRLPAEWAPQHATLLAWPSADGDWADDLPTIRAEYRQFIETILRFQPVILLTPPGDASASKALHPHDDLHLVEVPYNDTWCRDYGPITLVAKGQRRAMDFLFNGWGGKYPASLDNRVNTHLARHSLFKGVNFRQSLFELEGGAIECDGQGLLMINWHCLQARHPHMDREAIADELRGLLHVDRVIGIDISPMPGDDTDGHIDTLARFLPDRRIAFQDLGETERTGTLLAQLEALRDREGQAFDLLALPYPEGANPDLPCNYVNFLFVNGACLVPAYGVDNDEQARVLLDQALPDHQVILVPARQMISQFGGLHCASMHLPGAPS